MMVKWSSLVGQEVHSVEEIGFCHKNESKESFEKITLVLTESLRKYLDLQSDPGCELEDPAKSYNVVF